jgi:glycosyltransferase involved in cell wall biosynthesis
MRICLITDTYSPYFDGGAGLYVEDLARELSQIGDHVTVVTTTEFRGIRTFSFQQQNVSPNLSVFRMYPLNLYHKTAHNKHHLSVKPVWYLLDIWNIHSYLAFARLAQKEHWDVVHTHNLGSLSFSIISAIKKYKLPWVHSIHDYAFLCPRSTLYRSSNQICLNPPLPCSIFRLTKKIFWRSPDLALAPSKFALDLLSEYGFLDNCKKLILPYGIPFAHRQSDEMPRYRHAKRIGHGSDLKLLFIGRIDVFKGVEWLLRVFSDAPVPGVQLHIAGSGPQAARLRDKYQSPQVIFHGFVEGAQKHDLFRACDALIIPSMWYDNSPIVIYEAFSHGMPVLGSRIGGIPELVRDGETGNLFEPGDDQELIRAIRILASNRHQLGSMSQRCLQVAENLNISNHTEALAKYYHECIDLRCNSSGLPPLGSHSS